jgi:hypothetical protein
MRWWLWGSWLVTDAALVLAAVEFGRDWSWPVLTAGLAMAAVVAAIWMLPFVVFLLRRGDRLPLHERVMLQHRIVLYPITLVFVGTAVAIMAAMFDAAWILSAYIGLCLVIGFLALMLFAVLVRRLRCRYPKGGRA